MATLKYRRLSSEGWAEMPSAVVAFGERRGRRLRGPGGIRRGGGARRFFRRRRWRVQRRRHASLSSQRGGEQPQATVPGVTKGAGRPSLVPCTRVLCALRGAPSPLFRWTPAHTQNARRWTADAAAYKSPHAHTTHAPGSLISLCVSWEGRSGRRGREGERGRELKKPDEKKRGAAHSPQSSLSRSHLDDALGQGLHGASAPLGGQRGCVCSRLRGGGMRC